MFAQLTCIRLIKFEMSNKMVVVDIWTTMAVKFSLALSLKLVKKQIKPMAIAELAARRFSRQPKSEHLGRQPNRAPIVMAGRTNILINPTFDQS